MTRFTVSGRLSLTAAIALSFVAVRAWARQLVCKARSTPDAQHFGQSRLAATQIHRVPTLDGGYLHAEEFGDPTSPTTVLLVHGWTLSSDLWADQVERLIAHARVVTYDHRAHGRSDRPTEQFSGVDQLGVDLAAVIDWIAPEGNLVLVGHSMGGMTVMHLAAAHPELFRDRVKGVVLVSTSLGELADLDLGLPLPCGLLIKRFGKNALRGLARLEDSVGLTGPVPPELWLAARHLNFGPNSAARHVDNMLRVVRRTPLGVISDFYSALLAHDGSAGLPALTRVPVTIVVGDLDRLTPVAHSRRLKAELPHASLKIVSGAGHMVILERPEDVAEPAIAYVTSCRESELAPVGS